MILQKISESPNLHKMLWENIRYLRTLPVKKAKLEKQIQLDRPVAVYTKPDRLRHGPGIEFNVILRSPGCVWARSDTGGCTMCGYINDKAPETITSDQLWMQFSSALNQQKQLLEDSSQQIVFKIFTSGSFLDPNEIPPKIQYRILSALQPYESIKEIVVESRPQFITNERLKEYQQIILKKYFEIGVGLETADDFIRMNLINKGFSWKDFIQARDTLHEHNFGIKAYLLFKAPFLTEYASLIDLIHSIQRCISAGIDTISINPTNIQLHTLCEELYKVHAFRPPWFYSLLYAIKYAVRPQDLQKTRIISDPSALGLERGIHNCFDKTCNMKYAEILRDFVINQDLSKIPDQFPEPCWTEYLAHLMLGND